MDIRIKMPDELVFSRGQVTALLALLLICAAARIAGSESYTLEAYYPSPAGVYTNMTVLSNTTLARDGGRVGIGTASPASALSVNGSVQVADDAGACTAAKAGAIRWHSGRLDLCNGSAWGQLQSQPASGTWGGYCDRSTGAASYPATVCAKIPNGSFHAWYVAGCANGWTARVQTAPNPGSVTYTSSAECVKD